MNTSISSFMRYDETNIYDPFLSEQLKEINETEETKSKGLETLRRDLNNLKDIESCLDEDFLLRFLRVTKYDTSKALQRILKYYQQFDACLNVYKKFSFPLHKAESIRHLTISPFRCKDNSFLVFGNAGIDYKKFTFAHRFYLEIVALHKVLENPVNQICGGTYIIDYGGMDIHGLLAFTPFWVKFFVDALLNSLPCRLKAVHLINTPSFYSLIFSMFYPFLPKKIQNRVFVHAKTDDWEKLHASISPEILPEKYGGKLKSAEIIDSLQNLKELENNFLRLFAFGNIKTKKTRQSMKVFQ